MHIMLPKSRFLFKKTIFLKVAAFIVIIPTIIALTFTKNQPVADAQIAFLYASSCLGGWKNVDKVTGVPEVAGAPDVDYSEKNSATLYNKQTQLYCGGFAGQIPDGVDRTKVTVRFSWEAEGTNDPSDDDQESEESHDESTVLDTFSPNTESSSSTEETVEELPSEELPSEVQTEEVLESETPPAVEEVSWWRFGMPIAHAEEVSEVVEVVTVVEDIVVPETPSTESSDEATESSTSSKDIVESIPADNSDDAVSTSTPATSSVPSYVPTTFDENTDRDNAIFEVLFTMDNEEWYPLGYVSRINNDIAFELPLELFTSVEDFSKLQISLKTVERFDDTPKIYLDSIWLEVAYRELGEDPLSPPGTKEGDVIMSSVSTEETSLVTVFRGVKLETVSNIFSLPASTTATTTASSTLAQDLVVSASSTDTEMSLENTLTQSSSTPLVSFESDIPLETRKNIRTTPGVEVEIWLQDRLTDSWVRVADNTNTATVPYAAIIDSKVFWFGVDGASLWSFNILTRGYSSQSLSLGEPVAMEFLNSVGEKSMVSFNGETERLEEVAVEDVP